MGELMLNGESPDMVPMDDLIVDMGSDDMQGANQVSGGSNDAQQQEYHLGNEQQDM